MRYSHGLSAFLPPWPATLVHNSALRGASFLVFQSVRLIAGSLVAAAVACFVSEIVDQLDFLAVKSVFCSHFTLLHGSGRWRPGAGWRKRGGPLPSPRARP